MKTLPTGLLAAVIITSSSIFNLANGQVLNETLKLLPADGAASDRFGMSVEINGTTAIVGATRDDDNGSASGSVYIFDISTGNQLFKLLPSDGVADDYFGNSVAVNGTTAIVGACQMDPSAGWYFPASVPGSAYIFDTSTGNQLFKLLPNDGAPDDRFGWSVAVSGTTAIVGAYQDDDNGSESGSAYLFDTVTGTQLFKLLPNDGAADDLFGYSVSISGTTAIVGAFKDDDNGPTSGSAYLFDTTTGAQVAKLLPIDGVGSFEGNAGDSFGLSVAISGTTAIVGAHQDDDNGEGSGSAYLFDVSDPANPTEVAKLTSSDGAEWDWFGFSVDISDTTAIVGARYNDNVNGNHAGAAYLFDIITGAQIAQLLPSDGIQDEYFGSSVAVNGTTGLVGVPYDHDTSGQSGSAYLFDASNNNCTNATPLFGDGVFAVGNATVGAPDADPGCGNIGSDVWYEWTAAETGGVTMDMCDGTTTYDSVLAAWDGASGCPSTPITCNDDTCGIQSQVTFACVAGSVYMIQVGGFNGDTGTGNLTIDTDVPPGAPGSPFCFGDGSGTPCPCGNSGFSGEGCRNDTGFGASLSAMHSNSIASNDLKLIATGLTPGPGLYFQGNNAVNGGNGNPFGDGLRCVGNQVKRIEVRVSSGGTSSTTNSIADSGAVNAGDTKRYQLWYRDSGGSPCNSGFNLTNGYEITWTP